MSTPRRYFDEALRTACTRRLCTRLSDAETLRTPRTRFFNSGGEQLLLDVVEGEPADMASFDIGLNLSDVETGRLDGGAGISLGGGPRRGHCCHLPADKEGSGGQSGVARCRG